MGLDLLLPLFAAAILGGIGSVPGAMLAGLIVGLSEAFAVQLIGAEWRAAVAFVILVAGAAAAPAGPVREGGMSLELLSYGAFFLTMALSYAIICLGLNVQWGQTGLFNVGIAGFVAIGAYVSALLTTPDDRQPFRRLRPADRRRLDRRRARHQPRLVPHRRADHPAARRLSRHRHLRRRRGGAALRAQPRAGDRRAVRHRLHPAALRRACRRSAVRSASPISACSSLLVVVLYLVLERLARSPWGRVLRAIREDEQAALALGKNAVKFRLQAFAIGGGIMGLAGAVQAHFIGFIAPDNYMPMLTFQVWAMLIVGGSGNNRGAILGAVLVWGIWAASAGAVAALFPPGEQARAAALQIVMIGVALCAILLLRPRGILGEERVVSRHLGKPRAAQRQPASPKRSPPMPQTPDRIDAWRRPLHQPPGLRPVAGRRPREGRHDARSRAWRRRACRPMRGPASTPSTWPITMAAPS